MAVTVLVDDDALQARVISDNLQMNGHIVLWERTSWTALLVAHRVRPDLIIVDSAVPQTVEFMKLVRMIRGLNRVSLFVIASRRLPQYYLSKLGVSGSIDKPFDAAGLVQEIERSIHPAQESLPRPTRRSLKLCDRTPKQRDWTLPITGKQLLPLRSEVTETLDSA